MNFAGVIANFPAPVLAQSKDLGGSRFRDTLQRRRRRRRWILAAAERNIFQRAVGVGEMLRKMNSTIGTLRNRNLWWEIKSRLRKKEIRSRDRGEEGGGR